MQCLFALVEKGKTLEMMKFPPQLPVRSGWVYRGRFGRVGRVGRFGRFGREAVLESEFSVFGGRFREAVLEPEFSVFGGRGRIRKGAPSANTVGRGRS